MAEEKAINWEEFDWKSTDLDWNNFTNWDLSGLTSQEVGRINGLYTMWEMYAKDSPANSRNSSRSGSRKLPFRMPKLERIDRESQKPRGYKASALWQTSSLYYDLLRLFTPTLPRSEHRLRAQADDAGRSMVANIEEGYTRPTTLEYLEFLGFAYASWAEVDGDVDRMHSLGYLKSAPGSSLKSLGIPTPSHTRPYPPASSRRNPGKYGTLREKLREFTGKEIQAEDLTFEAFKEVSNKTGYLFRQTAEGLREKIIRDAEGKLEQELSNIWEKYW
ncbi:MAG: four helix bundle protein [Patescibacteria group bacterium]